MSKKPAKKPAAPKSGAAKPTVKPVATMQVKPATNQHQLSL